MYKTGAQAVSCFFVLSGYLMAKSIDATYGRTWSGFFKYITNRVLRIYPTYWLVLLSSCLFLMFFPSKVLISQMVLTSDLSAVFANITLFNLYSYDNIFVPPAWSLTIELLFYIVIGLIPLDFKMARLGFILSVPLLAAVYFLGFDTNEHITRLAQGQLCFSLGAFVNYSSRQIRKYKLVYSIVILSLLIFSWYILSYFSLKIYPSIMYIGAFASGAMIIVLRSFSFENFSAPLGRQALVKADKFLGDIAYPLFLVHYFIGQLLAAVGIPPFTIPFFLSSLLTSIGISALMVKYFEDRINRLRDLVRGRKAFSASQGR